MRWCFFGAIDRPARLFAGSKVDIATCRRENTCQGVDVLVGTFLENGDLSAVAATRGLITGERR